MKVTKIENKSKYIPIGSMRLAVYLPLYICIYMNAWFLHFNIHFSSDGSLKKWIVTYQTIRNSKAVPAGSPVHLRTWSPEFHGAAPEKRTPWKMKTAGSPTAMGPMKRKEHDLNQSSINMFHLNLEGVYSKLQYQLVVSNFFCLRNHI